MQMNIVGRGEVLHVEFTGDYKPESAVVYCREMGNPETAEGAEAFLLDMSSIGKPMKVLEAYSFVKELHNSVGSKPVALIGREESQAEDFCAVVGKNRGMKLEIFRTREEAVAWLFYVRTGKTGQN
ncbi:MAG: hypothetical protein LLG37_01425 [Spirochaetia bacterium]|nr:hypothetical protein [Spirochaetia bacterium]